MLKICLISEKMNQKLLEMLDFYVFRQFSGQNLKKSLDSCNFLFPLASKTLKYSKSASKKYPLSDFCFGSGQKVHFYEIL